MKKILVALMLCFSSFAMDNYGSRISNLENDVSTIKTDVTSLKNTVNGEGGSGGIAEIIKIIEDVPDPDDPFHPMIPGLKTKVLNNEESIKRLQKTVEDFQNSNKVVSDTLTMLTSTITDTSKQVGELNVTVNDLKTRLEAVETSLNTNITASWENFLSQKFEEYMKVKKQVLDIITALKIKGDPTPTYIVETAAQLKACDLDTRRTALTNVLAKLEIFGVLLNGSKIELLRNYLTNTDVPKPNIREIEKIMSTVGIIIDGDYIKITGELRSFVRKTYLGSGVPHESWMDINYDYFGYKRLDEIKRVIIIENAQRKAKNTRIEYENAMAEAAYKAGIEAANRVDFPYVEFDSIVSDYNRLLTRHEI